MPETPDSLQVPKDTCCSRLDKKPARTDTDQRHPAPRNYTTMSEPTDHLEREPRDVDMQPTPPPPVDFNMLHEHVTWLTKEVEALQHEAE